MKSRFLLPHTFKPLGWVLFLIGLVLGVFLLINNFDYFDWEVKVFPLLGDSGLFSSNPSLTWSTNNIADEIASILLIIGGVLVVFSRTKDEDEYISKIRMESLIWATYVNYFVLLLAVLLVFDFSFFTVLVINMFTVLFFFIFRFHYVLYKSKQVIRDE